MHNTFVDRDRDHAKLHIAGTMRCEKRLIDMGQRVQTPINQQ